MLIYYLSAWAIASAIAIGLHAATKQKDTTGPVPAIQKEPETVEKEGEGDPVRAILGRAYWELSKRGVPWLWRLSSIARHPGPVPPSVAIQALQDTRAELAGKYNLRALDDAIQKVYNLR